MEAKEIYDGYADLWVRNEPVLLSDYSARPRVLELCGDVEGKSILDLGCGEGYVGRQLAQKGAASVKGYDVSGGMIEGAKKTATEAGLDHLTYAVSDLREAQFGDAENPVDLVVAVFLFNYMDSASMSRILDRIRTVLKPGGRFIFTVPHPLLPWIKPAEKPFYMRPEGGYLSAVDVPFPGRIWRRDGASVEVQAVHKTFTTYFNALAAAGFTSMPHVEELHITAEHVALDPDFFGPLVDLPLHVAFSLSS
ncbi:MAG: class I SAM-dependent methyltransferase [Flavobacteriales bacterium]|jgi:SAM-dependent methyltransferase|nr:class I SAM-dependent methyltransferase [Flavobacteriales bacterium]